MLLQCVNVRAFTFVFHLTRFPDQAQMAIRFGKTRVAFWPSVENLSIGLENRLTSKFIAPTMPILTCTYVLVDKK
jgi:hypothetical protein